MSVKKKLTKSFTGKIPLRNRLERTSQRSKPKSTNFKRRLMSSKRTRITPRRLLKVSTNSSIESTRRERRTVRRSKNFKRLRMSCVTITSTL